MVFCIPCKKSVTSDESLDDGLKASEVNKQDLEDIHEEGKLDAPSTPEEPTSDDSLKPASVVSLEKEDPENQDIPEKKTISEAEILRNLNQANIDTPVFSFKEYVTRGKIVKVYDADTVHIVMPHPLDQTCFLRFKCRLYGIDTVELKGETKDQAMKERDMVAKKILNKIVKVECHGEGKYGRVLVTIFLKHGRGWININQWILKNTEGSTEYYGGTKG